MVADRFRLRYKLTRDHYQSYLKLAGKRAGGKSFLKSFFITLPVGILSGVLLVYLQRNGLISSRDIWVFFMGLGVAVIAIGLISVIANKRMVSNIVGAHDAMIGEFTLAAYEGGGIQITGKHIQSSFDWTAFMDLTQTSDIMVLWIDKGAGTILPNSAFSDDNERQQFTDFVNERIESYKQSD